MSYSTPMPSMAVSGSNYRSPSRQDRHHLTFLDEEPEMAIPENVEISGDISFDRYLAIDGSFEGSIISPTEGDIYVGPHGVVNSNLKSMGTIVIEGTVVGDIIAHNLVLRGHASVTGNVRCSTVEMGPQATMIGQMKSDPTEQVEMKTTAPPPLQKNNILIILDPQVDFHSNGRCPIEGADQNSKCIAKFIIDHKEVIEEIIVGLDNHHRMHISNGVFWVNSFNESPPVNTIITVSDVEEGSWRPRDETKEVQDFCKAYVKQLKEMHRYPVHIWPEHCLIGSSGHAVVQSINNSLQEWAEFSLNTVTYVMKGTNPLTEMYSLLSAEVPIKTDSSTQLDSRIISRLETAERVIVCGSSLSHSVNFTCKDILQNWTSSPSKLYILTDGLLSVPGFENEAERFVEEMKANGVNVLSFEEFDFNSSV